MKSRLFNSAIGALIHIRPYRDSKAEPFYFFHNRSSCGRSAAVVTTIGWRF
jgi:hypothetical protein